MRRDGPLSGKPLVVKAVFFFGEGAPGIGVRNRRETHWTERSSGDEDSPERLTRQRDRVCKALAEADSPSEVLRRVLRTPYYV